MFNADIKNTELGKAWTECNAESLEIDLENGIT